MSQIRNTQSETQAPLTITCFICLLGKLHKSQKPSKLQTRPSDSVPPFRPTYAKKSIDKCSQWHFADFHIKVIYIFNNPRHSVLPTAVRLQKGSFVREAVWWRGGLTNNKRNGERENDRKWNTRNLTHVQNERQAVVWFNIYQTSSPHSCIPASKLYTCSMTA
jgi:hypothetical protein